MNSMQQAAFNTRKSLFTKHKCYTTVSKLLFYLRVKSSK